ncbi:MAG: TolC family protein, partial [Gemmatimonadaceae bacterium]
FPDKFRLRNSLADAEIQSFDFQFTLLRQQVAAATARSYDSLLVTRRHRRDLTEGRTLADEFQRKAQARFEAGTVARLDVLRARVDLAQADNALIANERDIANAEAALNRLLGLPLGTAIVAADSLDVPLPVPELDVLEAKALAVRPELSDLSAQRRGASAATSLAREFWLPDLFVSANRDYAQPGGYLFSTGIALPFPVFFWQHSKGELAESRSRQRELSASYRDLQAAVGQDVRAAYASAVISLRQVIYLRDELLPAAREAFRVASVGYGLGGVSALEVLDARRTLLDAESQYTDALAAASSARSDLERAIGAPLDSLGMGGVRE